MNITNTYKPRYKLSYQTKSKIWPYKNSYLRGFYLIRSNWIKPKTWQFKKYFIVAKNIKWHEARNYFNPNIKKLSKKLIFGKKAYGRPKALSQRYKILFYQKQKLRKFYGKLNENKFRIIFKTHKINVASNSNSFFVSLESRLDVVFFRIRLLPTIFTCHQYILYNGLELNTKLEKSPSCQLQVGDILSVPQSSWLFFYYKIFKRVYYRRWGQFITKRRFLKKIKRIYFFKKINIGNNKTNSKKLKVVSKKIKIKLFWLKKIYTQKFVNININAITVKKAKIYYNNKIKKSITYFTFKNIKNVQKFKDTIKLITDDLHIFKEVADHFKGWIKQFKLKSTVNITLLNKIKKEQQEEKIDFLIEKYLQYQKRYFANRYYTYNKRKRWSWPLFRSNHTKWFNQFKWFCFKINKKKERKQRITRIKSVHFFVPSYLQIDFRTLTLIKIKSPSIKERYYPFQMSLAKTYTFYKSRGYLFLY